MTQPTSENRLLFDLESDPGERGNLFCERQDKTQELQSRLAAWDKEMNTYKPRFCVR